MMEANVGKRMLLKVQRTGRFGIVSVTEFRVLEVAPSGRWVKLRDLCGVQFWVATEDVSVVEELRDFRAERIAERQTLD